MDRRAILSEIQAAHALVLDDAIDARSVDVPAAGLPHADSLFTEALALHDRLRRLTFTLDGNGATDPVTMAILRRQRDCMRVYLACVLARALGTAEMRRGAAPRSSPGGGHTDE